MSAPSTTTTAVTTTVPTGTRFTCTISGSNIACGFPEDIEKTLADISKSTSAFKMVTGGTEYFTGETASVFVRILTANSQAINLADCNTTIYFPNKTVFVANQPLAFLERGLYYKDITVPDTIGNYMVTFDCYFPAQSYFSNRTLNIVLGGLGSSYPDAFPFDNSQNTTIVNAWIAVSSSSTATGGELDLYFNGKYIGTNYGKTPPVGNWSLNQSDFAISEEQGYAVTNGGTGVQTIYWVALRVNYLLNTPPQIIRGQTEMNVHNISKFCNVVINTTNTTVNITNVTTVVDLTNVTSAIISVNDTLKGQYLNLYDYMVAHNASVFGKLYLIQDDLSDIKVMIGNITLDTTDLQNLISAVNGSVFNKLASIQGDITSVGDTVVAVNNTLYWQMDAHNSTVMWKLYKIQDEIASINMTIINATLNITFPTTTNLTNETINEITDDVIVKMLMNARILNQRIVNFHNQQYCADNVTLIHNITYDYCVGNNCRIMRDIMPEDCHYGCDQQLNVCKDAPYKNALWILGGVVGFIVLILLILRLSGKI